MKYYKVIYKATTEEGKKQYNTNPSDFYYVADNNVCFAVDVYDTIREVDVVAYSVDAIHKVYDNIISVELIKEEDNLFDQLMQNNYVRPQGKYVVKNKVYNTTIDKPCSEEIQNLYKKYGESWYKYPVTSDMI